MHIFKYGKEWRCAFRDDGRYIEFALSKERVEAFVKQLNEAAMSGAPWDMYEKQDTFQ